MTGLRMGVKLQQLDRHVTVDPTSIYENETLKAVQIHIAMSRRGLILESTQDSVLMLFHSVIVQ